MSKLIKAREGVYGRKATKAEQAQFQRWAIDFDRIQKEQAVRAKEIIKEFAQKYLTKTDTVSVDKQFDVSDAMGNFNGTLKLLRDTVDFLIHVYSEDAMIEFSANPGLSGTIPEVVVTIPEQ